MGHGFATGAAKPQRTQIQQGAIALLAGLKRPAGYLVDVIPFGAVVRSHSDEEGVAMLVDAIAGRVPSLAVALGDRTSEPLGIGGYSARSQLDMLVYFASGNARNQQIGRQQIDGVGLADDRADPGLHVMMEHAVELLIGQWPGIPKYGSVKQIQIETEEELATTPAVTIWLQTYKITTTTTVSEWRTATQLLTAIGFGLGGAPDFVYVPGTTTGGGSGYFGAYLGGSVPVVTTPGHYAFVASPNQLDIVVDLQEP